MQARNNPASETAGLFETAGNAYYGNPYLTQHEQYGLEFVDRSDSDDDIEKVVILGYN